jgi:integrase
MVQISHTNPTCKTPKGRASKGAVSLESIQNRLRLRFRVCGRQFVLGLGLSDTPGHRAHARTISTQIERDILFEQFDTTLEKYRPAHLKLFRSDTTDLSELWEKFTTFRTPQIARTTLLTKYGEVTRTISLLPTRKLNDAVKIRDHLLATVSARKCKHLLMMFNACGKWALKSKLITTNPFEGMVADITLPKDSKKDIDPFTAAERDAILDGFAKDPYYSYYTPFVRFLFWTGCRTSEAVGLRWKHISPDWKRIRFVEVITIAKSQRIEKGTKTGKARDFPINDQLRALLESQKTPDSSPDDFVFPSKKGYPIHACNFSNFAWKGGKKICKGRTQEGVVSRLVAEGKVERYRPPYNTRHTFITLMLEAQFTPQEVARLVPPLLVPTN